MRIKAFVALSIALANPAGAAEEFEAGGSGAWTFPSKAGPADVGSEQMPALGRFVYSAPSGGPMDVTSAQAEMVDRTLTSHGLPVADTLIARAPGGGAPRN